MMAKKGSRKQVGRKRKNKGTTAKSRTAVSGRAAYVQSPKEKRPRTTFNFLGITREYLPSYMDLTAGAMKLTPFSASSSSSSTSVPPHPMLADVIHKSQRRRIFWWECYCFVFDLEPPALWEGRGGTIAKIAMQKKRGVERSSEQRLPWNAAELNKLVVIGKRMQRVVMATLK